MAVFNYSTRELTTKIVYYGPGLCGKTTNLQYIYDHLKEGVRGKMLSLATKSDRTLFFDFLPVDIGEIHGMKTKVQLYTVPGQVFYNETRRLVLRGADGVVFVADSQENMLEANLDSFRNLEENLAAHGINLRELPHVLQYNKRDLPNVLPVEVLDEKLNKYNAPFYEAIATTGVGVQETLRHITKLVLIHLNERYGGARKEQEATPAAGSETPASPPQVAVAGPAPADAPAAAAPAPAPAVETPAAPTAPSPAAETPAPPPTIEMPAAAAAAPEAPVPAPPPPTLEMPPAAPAPEPPAPPALETPAAAAPPSAAGDVLGVAAEPSAGAAPAAVARDEDVLGVLPEAPPPPATAGKTQKIDRELLGELFPEGTTPAPVAQEPPPAPAPSPAEPEPPRAQAEATAIPVDATDPLFQEEGVEPTVLAPGEPREILVPLVVRAGNTEQRYRLVLRLEVKP